MLIGILKIQHHCQALVAHDFNPSTLEAGAGKSLCLYLDMYS